MLLSILTAGFCIASALSFFFSWIVRTVACMLHIVDDPRVACARKIHTTATPLLGGIAVIAAFFITVGMLLFSGVDLFAGALQAKHIIGLGVAATIIAIGGVLDDRFTLRPRMQFIFPLIAVAVVVASGIGINYITNPLGGQIRLDTLEYILFWMGGWPYKLTLIADLFTVVWLLGMTYTTKFLDGLDGLVAGMAVIGGLLIALLALDPVVGQWEVALLAVTVAGAFFGFLFWNWHPARLFLGESGALFAGFLLGTLSIISGSKVAITVFVLGIPIFDVVWTIVRRVFFEKRSPFAADKKHIHFRLLDAGFSVKQAVLVLYFFAAYFGIAALFLQSSGALIAFFILSSVMLTLGFGVVIRKKRSV